MGTILKYMKLKANIFSWVQIGYAPLVFSSHKIIMEKKLGKLFYSKAMGI